MNLKKLIVDTLHTNDGKLTPSLIDYVADHSETTYTQLSPNTRVCLLKLPTGHELVGVAQVLDAANDVESIGNSVAYRNAKEQLWQLCGSIAKFYI